MGAPCRAVAALAAGSLLVLVVRRALDQRRPWQLEAHRLHRNRRPSCISYMYCLLGAIDWVCDHLLCAEMVDDDSRFTRRIELRFELEWVISYSGIYTFENLTTFCLLQVNYKSQDSMLEHFFLFPLMTSVIITQVTLLSTMVMNNDVIIMDLLRAGQRTPNNSISPTGNIQSTVI